MLNIIHKKDKDDAIKLQEGGQKDALPNTKALYQNEYPPSGLADDNMYLFYGGGLEGMHTGSVFKGAEKTG